MMLGLGCNMKILMLVELTYLCVINEWPVTVTSFVPSVHIVESEYYVDTSHQICINMWGKGSSNIDWESRKEKLVHNSPTNAHEWIYYLSRQFNQLSNILMFNICSGLYRFIKTIMYNGDSNKFKEKSQKTVMLAEKSPKM